MVDSTNVHLRTLVAGAIKAASSHNTQPWRFRLEPRRITVMPDLERRCPIVDPDDHHLFASLGCAVENLVLTAPAAGLHAHTGFDESTGEIPIDLDTAPASTPELVHAIDLRQCSRSLYDGSPLSAAEARKLEEAGQGDGVRLHLLTGDRTLEQVAEYVAAGNTAQFADPAWRRELQHWVRFNARSARTCGDGLYGPSMGNPAVPDWLGRLFMKLAFSVEQQIRKDSLHIRKSSAVAVIVSERDDRRHWVEAGRSYQRFALQAAAMNLRTAFINQPVEVAELRPQFAAHLGLGPAERPDLLIRVGRGPLMPRSFRRPLDAVIV
jgi:nitroreductase